MALFSSVQHRTSLIIVSIYNTTTDLLICFSGLTVLTGLANLMDLADLLNCGAWWDLHDRERLEING